MNNEMIKLLIDKKANPLKLNTTNKNMAVHNLAKNSTYLNSLNNPPFFFFDKSFFEKKNLDGFTPFHFVVSKKASLNVLNYFLENQANPNLCSNNRNTPFHLLVFNSEDNLMEKSKIFLFFYFIFIYVYI